MNDPEHPDRGEEDPDGQRRPRDAGGASAGTDSDDTTQADAGLVGGTGAAPAEGTHQPMGTVPPTEDEGDDPTE